MGLNEGGLRMYKKRMRWIVFLAMFWCALGACAQEEDLLLNEQPTFAEPEFVFTMERFNDYEGPQVIENRTEFDTVLASFVDTAGVGSIDFDRYELVYDTYCTICSSVCPPTYDQCHRQACDYRAGWVLKPKE